LDALKEDIVKSICEPCSCASLKIRESDTTLDSEMNVAMKDVTIKIVATPILNLDDCLVI
jgi:hypothetical protein